MLGEDSQDREHSFTQKQLGNYTTNRLQLVQTQKQQTDREKSRKFKPGPNFGQTISRENISIFFPLCNYEAF